MLQEVQIEKRLFSVSEYYKMAESGILSKDAKVELINGEIISMSPIKSYHAGMINVLNYELFKSIGEQAAICVQNPIRLNDFSEPEPDITIAKYKKGRYQNNHPTGTDIYFLIEVSDTTLNFDRHTKASLYAEAGIPEYWIINLQKQQIEIYTQTKNGEYLNRFIAKKGDTAKAQGIGFELNVSELFS